jgi:hypothetical protein
MTAVQRTPKEWFEEAARCYLEHHQGCAWCGGSHRVYKRPKGHAVTYYCHSCDFHIAHDESSNEYFFVPGDDRDETAVDTMYEI